MKKSTRFFFYLHHPLAECCARASDEMSCARCNAHAEPAYSIVHRTCGHSTHTDCLPLGEETNFKLCFNCDPATAALAAAAATTGGGSRRKVAEPHTKDAVEYWRVPGKRNENGSRSIISTVISPFRRTPAEQQPPTPFQLLKSKTPIGQIMSKHGYGLDHILRDGLDIEDFLVNGYDWDDLCQFEYISAMGPVRCLETLTRGLLLTANHLRDNKDRLPVAAIMKATEMPTSDWNKRLGLVFPENGPLHCFGDNNWNAMDCVAMGLTMDDLMDLGMFRVEQYQDLMKGLTRKERANAERDLRATPEHIAQLEAPPTPPEEEEVEEQEEEVRREAQEQQPRSEDEEEEEEEEEEEVEDRPPSPPPAKPAAKSAAKPVASKVRDAPRRQAAVSRSTKSVTEARMRERMRMDGFVGKKK